LNGVSANKTPYLSDTPLTGNQLTLARQPGQTQITNRLVLNGVSIGEFVDELIVPGYTFSWSPEELRLIAFRANTGRLSIMIVNDSIEAGSIIVSSGSWNATSRYRMDVSARSIIIHGDSPWRTCSRGTRSSNMPVRRSSRRRTSCVVGSIQTRPRVIPGRST